MPQHARWALAAAVTLAANQAIAQQIYGLQHTNSIDLSSLFTTSSGYGNNSLSIAFDGTNAYIGGYNNSAASSNIGVVQVQGVLGSTPVLTGLPSTQLSASSSRGLDALASDGTYLYIAHDSGSAATSFIEKLRISDLSVIWQTFSPGGQRPMAMAIDPTGDAGSPTIAFLASGQGRRLSLKDSDGSLLYTISGQANPGGIINSAPALGTSWRAMAFDSSGNIALAEDSGVAYGLRVNPNQWKDLAGTNNQTTRSDLKSVAQNNVGNGVALLEGAATSPLLVFSPRVAGSGSSTSLTLTDSTGVVTNASSGDIQLRNPDGTTTGLLQTSLHGDEDGIGGPFTTELKNFAVAKDASGLPILLAVSSLERRLDIYQMEPTYTADADGNWSESAKWLAGVVPASATLNAHFAPTTASRTITIDGSPVTKDLKLNSANSYTFIGATLTIDAPAGQTGNVQVLQGTHSIQNPLSLSKTTTFTIAAGADLSVTGGVTGSGGLTKSGPGNMTLGGLNSISGPLALSAGTLTLTGTLTLPAGGTATSKLSAGASLLIGPSAKLDLNDNDAVWDYDGPSPIDTLRAYLLAGRASGSWNGPGGITSSAASSSTLTSIAYAESSLLGNPTTFSGQPVSPTSLLLKYTYTGDANLDGAITPDDYTLLDRSLALSLTNAHWTDGDFNYDGHVDQNDYLLIDTVFGQAQGFSPGFLAERESQFGDTYVQTLLASIPEPSSLSSLLYPLSSFLFLPRRRSPRP